MAQPPTPDIHRFTNPTGFHPLYNNDYEIPTFEYHRSEKTYDLNSKIMLAAIVSLSLVVILVITLHIYARCFLRRQARRRAIIRESGLNSAGNVHSGEPPKMGLHSSVIASLPIIIYKKSDNGEVDSSNSIECAVCLSFLEEQEIARVLPNCKHMFHAQCIDKWLSSRSTCPICRTEAEPLILPVPREGPITGNGSSMSMVNFGMELGNSSNNNQDGYKVNNNGASSSSSRLNSFRRMLSRERSSRRIQHEIQEEALEDIERQ